MRPLLETALPSVTPDVTSALTLGLARTVLDATLAGAAGASGGTGDEDAQIVIAGLVAAGLSPLPSPAQA